MPKINKKTIFKFDRIPVSVFQFENSKNYFVRYYVGRQKGASGGNKDKSLKTQNKNEAKVKAKEIYFEYLNSPTIEKKEIDFNIDIAQPFFRYRIRHYKNKNPDSTQGTREKMRYDSYIHKFFEDVDYRNNEDLQDAIEELKENLKQDEKTDNTISKYFNILSLMFRKAVENNLIKRVPYFPPLKVVNQVRHSYQNEELNLINRKLDDEFKKTEEKFYLHMKDYLNLFHSLLDKIHFLETIKIEEKILIFDTLIDKSKNNVFLVEYFNNYLDILKNNTLNSYLKSVVSA